MKISFDGKRAFNNFSGLGNYSRTLIRDLQRWFPDNEYLLYTPKMVDDKEINWMVESNNYTIHKAKRKLFSSLWRSWGVIKDIKRDKPDIYHGLSHDIPFTVKKSGKTRATKYVVTIHDVCYRTYPKMFSFIDRVIYQLKYSHSIKVADAIVAISESTKRDIIKYFPSVDRSKIHTVYQSLNSIYYELMSHEEAVEVVRKRDINGDFLLYVGSINSRKNLLGVVKAYALLPKEMQLPLVVIGGGGGSYKSEVMQFVNSSGIADKIIFFSDVKSSKELQAFYTAASVMIYPSFYEGLGLPVGEALLCGTSVITSNISSLPEVGGDMAYYVDPYSVESIRDGIVEVIGDKKESERRAQEGREYVLNKFNPKLLTTQMESLYRELKR